MNNNLHQLDLLTQRPERAIADVWPQTESALRTLSIKGIQDDARLIQPGEAWLCLPSVGAQKTDYLKQAVLAGSSLCIQVGSHPVESTTLPELTLVDMDQAGQLLRNWYATNDSVTTCIGITGTDGKTSVTWMLRQALQRLHGACWSIGTLGWVQDDHQMQPLGNTTVSLLNNHRLLAAASEHGIRHLVMEVSSHGIAQQRIAGLPFSAAVWTTLGQDHLDYHGDVETYTAIKSSFVRSVSTSGGTLVCNADQEPLVLALQERNIAPFWYSRQETHLDRDHLLQWNLLPSSDVVLRLAEQSCVLADVPAGLYHAENIAAVGQLLSAHFGCSLEQSVPLLRGITPPPGRMQALVDQQHRRVFIDYAHTAEGLEACLQAAKQMPHRQLLLVFGCGGDRDQDKRPRMGRAAVAYADEVWLTTDNPRNEVAVDIIADIQAGIAVDASAIVHVEQDRGLAIAAAIAALTAKDILIIAGKGHEDYMELANGQHIPWLDEDVAQECLRKVEP